jgi:spore maturation protein CgeB
MTMWDVVILGLSITSSWGNGHATTWRALVRELVNRGHRVTFLERDVPWYRDNRDLPDPPYGRTNLYSTLDELRARHARAVRRADLVIIGSYVPDGISVCEWVLSEATGTVAFYDIDTPVTLAALARGDCAYLSHALVPQFDLYLSFTGGPTLRRLEYELGATRARALYCSVDPRHYHPEPLPQRWDLGYLGTYAADRQPVLDRLLLEPASRWPDGRFVVAGPSYPDTVRWPANVSRIDHLPPDSHRAFYNQQRFTLNATRADMVSSGYAPSVRLFEAAACATPIVSDAWPGLDELFVPDEEILIAEPDADWTHVLSWLREVSETRRRELGVRARQRVLGAHTASQRVIELERHVQECHTLTVRAP